MKRMILTAALVLGLCAVLSAQEVIAEGKTFSALDGGTTRYSKRERAQSFYHRI
jgi:hypothetical protein